MKMDKSLKQQFKDIFRELCEKRPKFKAWNDCIHMWAYAISNCCDYRQEREDEYLLIAKQYTKTELDRVSELLAVVVMALEANRHQDFLGQLYMEYGFGDAKKGEYFTPYEIASMMAKIIDDGKPDKKPYISINDPACGSGVMLIAYANKLLEKGCNHHLKMLAIANDSDPCIALMCYIQLSLLGCAGYVCIRNTLTEPMTNGDLSPPNDAYITPLFFHPVWEMRKIRNSLEDMMK